MIPRWVRVRLLLCAGVLAACFVALGRKAWTLQVDEAPRLAELGRKQYWRDVVLPPPRGSIRDIHGVELAVSVDVSSAYVNPRAIADVARSAAVLAPALRLDVRELEEKLASGRRFEWLRRHLSPDQARLVRALALPGVGVVAEPRRFYPARELAGPVLGFAGVDGRGIEGLELSLDAQLRGERTKVALLRDNNGQLVIPADGTPGAVPGADVTLTLDRYLQWSAERALAEGVRSNQAKAGLAIVLDPRNGAVLAMASTPGLDPNAPAAAKEARNRPVTDAYEPGSVMKVFSIVAALDAGAIAPTDVIDVEGGKLAIGRRVIRDTHKGERLLIISDVVKFSSNVGAIKIARKLGKEKLHAALLRMGFGERTGIALPGEARGRVRDPERWGESGLATVSYGYGMTATPAAGGGRRRRRRQPRHLAPPDHPLPHRRRRHPARSPPRPRRARRRRHARDAEDGHAEGWHRRPHRRARLHRRRQDRHRLQARPGDQTLLHRQVPLLLHRLRPGRRPPPRGPGHDR
jgi:cell division protein FtsI (penicillin-binding protein 3)